MRGFAFVMLFESLAAPTFASAQDAIQSLFAKGAFDSVVAFQFKLSQIPVDSDRIWWSHYLIAKSLFYLGENVASDSLFATLDQQRIQSPSMRARISLDHSLVLTEMGLFDQAESRLALARSSLGPFEDSLTARYYNYKGVLDLRRAHYADARRFFYRALDILKNGEDLKQTAFVLSNLGMVSMETGRYQEAQAFYQEAMRLDSLQSDRQSLASDYLNLGNLFNELNDFPNSLHYYELALKLNRECGDSAGIATALLNMATVYESTKRFPEALDLQLEVIRLTLRQGDRLGEAHCRQNTANLYAVMGCFRESLDHFFHAFRIYRELGRYGDVREVLLSIADVYSLVQKPDSARFYLTAASDQSAENLDSVWAWSVLYRAARIAHREGRLIEADSLYQLAEDAIRKMRVDAGGLGDYVTESTQGDVFRNHIALFLQMKKTGEAIRRLRLLRTESTNPKKTEMAVEVHDADNSARIVYFLHDTMAFAIGIRGQDTVVCRLQSEDRLNSAGAEFLAIIRNPNANPNAIRLAGQRVYGLAVLPLQTFIRRTRLIQVEPDGVLAFIPFEALWTGQEFMMNRYRIEFSLGLVDGVIEPSNGDSAVFVFGDSRSMELPFATEEKNMAVAHSSLKWHVTSSDIDAAARLSRHVRLLHVAAHGVNHASRPKDSYLAVSSEGSHEDGMWTLSEIQSLRLEGCLVILSACGSAVGVDYGSFGVHGLARAFLDAGASAVVSTLWEVRDRSAAEFMRMFYDEYLVGRQSATVSLSNVKQALQNFTPPYGWAPYILWRR